jgi:hypothetical protein
MDDENTGNREVMKTAPPKRNHDQLVVRQGPGETQADALAKTALRPAIQAALTVQAFNSKEMFGEADINTLVGSLAEQCTLANGGDLSQSEALLVAQAHSLDVIFNTLARRAAHNVGENPERVQQYLRLALKAQSQSRATIETLAAMKNPPVIIAKQANISAGHQQVNNGAPSESSRAGGIENQPSRVLEHQHAERLDTGTSTPAIDADTAMATVGEIDRPQKRVRQAARGA